MWSDKDFRVGQNFFLIWVKNFFMKLFSRKLWLCWTNENWKTESIFGSWKLKKKLKKNGLEVFSFSEKYIEKFWGNQTLSVKIFISSNPIFHSQKVLTCSRFFVESGMTTLNIYWDDWTILKTYLLYYCWHMSNLSLHLRR